MSVNTPQQTEGEMNGREIQQGQGERLRPRGADTYPIDIEKRVEAANEEELTVYPMARGMYEVGVESETSHVVNLDGYTKEHGFRGLCLCRDFMYRCAEQDIDCKHIIRVKELIREGWLPPMDVDPVPWMEARLDSLKAEVEEAIEGTFSSVLEEEYQAVLDELNAIDDPLRWDVKEMTLRVEEVLEGELTDFL